MVQPSPWTQQSSRTIHKTAWLELVEDKVIQPNGKPGLYTYVNALPFVGILVQDKDDRFLLIQLYRYTTGQPSWEIPAGGLEPNETHEQAARRELSEETSLKAESWTNLGHYQESNGYAHCRGEILLARELNESTVFPTDIEEGILDGRWVTLVELKHMVANGEITDSVTLAALALLLARS